MRLHGTIGLFRSTVIFCAFGMEKTNEFINLDRPTIWKLRAQRGWEERKEEANEGNMLISTRARIRENQTVMQEGSGRRRERGGGGGGSWRRGGGERKDTQFNTIQIPNSCDVKEGQATDFMSDLDLV